MKTTKLLIALLVIAASWSLTPAHAIDGITANTPQEMANLHQEDLLNAAGEKALRSGRYVEAEKDFRAIQSLDRLDAGAYRGIGEALAGQGRLAEAVQAYQTLIYQDRFKWSSIAQDTRTLMHYAILLSEMGRWPEAVSVYEKALPTTPNFGDVPIMGVHFDPRVPMPVQLQTVAHIASGMEYYGGGEKKDAFSEFNEAAVLAPDSALANYYYGFGWRSLDPKDQAKIGSVQQAKSALQKAVLLGKGDVKKAAEKALKDLNKPTNKPA